MGFEFDCNDTCDKATPSMASNNGEGMALRGESETHCTELSDNPSLETTKHNKTSTMIFKLKSSITILEQD